MPDGGTITVSAHNATASEETMRGDYVAISVTDTGTGIAPDVLDKIFDPFFTTKPIGKGTGLGLSQVHGFAHQAGGTVKVTSELGKGTEVTMLLPREHASPQVEDAEAVEAGGSGTVLLVEDNPDVASVSISCSSSSAIPSAGSRMPRPRCAKSTATASIWYSPTS